MSKEELATPNGIDLGARGIDEIQAAGLRARLTTFAEGWARPEANIYDEGIGPNADAITSR